MYTPVTALNAVNENLMADESTREVMRRAELGDAEAQYRLGCLYSNEMGNEGDEVAEEAVKWLERAAEQGNVLAQFLLAFDCCPEFDRDLPPLRNDPASALKWMRAAAEQGSSDAIMHMGEIYERGLAGVARDGSEAAKWYLIGARKDEGGASHFASRLIALLKITSCQVSKQDEALVFAVLRAAAEKGEGWAQQELANVYAHGLAGLAGNDEEAIKWHNLAAAERDECPWGGFDTREIEVFRQNAEQCSARLQRHLGQWFEKNENGGNDVSEAARWYERSAAQGDAQAQLSIALMYDRGEGVSQDDAMAVKWYRAAAEQGVADAQNNLGVMYDEGRGVEQSHRLARRWYLAAGRQGEATALYNLGLMYLFGPGIPKDAIRAKRWFRASSRRDYLWGTVALAIVTGENSDLLCAARSLFHKHKEALFGSVADCVSQVGEFREMLGSLVESNPLPKNRPIWESDWDESYDKHWWRSLSGPARTAMTLRGMLFLIDVETDEIGARACLELSEKNGDPVAGYYLAKLDSWHGLHDLALKHIQTAQGILEYRHLKKSEGALEWILEHRHLEKSEGAPELGYGDVFLDSLDLLLRELKQQIRDSKAKEELRQAEIKAAEETHKQTLSFLTHTLNNALSTGPETVRTVIEILGSDFYDQGQAEYKAINNMASLFSVFLFAESLLKTFKLYVSDPEQVREKWNNDNTGDANVSLVMAMALRQSIARFVFSSNYLAQLKRLLPTCEKEAIKELRKSFVGEIIPLEITATTAGKLFDWIKEHFSLLHIEIDADAEMHFASNATRYMFFFAAFSELIYNALKYADGARPIEVKWCRDGDDYCFTCCNSVDAPSTAQPSREGANKGLFFVHKLMAMLKGSGLDYALEAGEFRASLRFGHDNFRESDG